MCRSLLAIGGAVLLACMGCASAQTTVGVASVLVVPVVAQTPSYSSEIFLLNASPTAPLTVEVTFIGGIGSDSPGMKDCGTVALPFNASVTITKSFTLASQCGLGAGKHFGMIILSDNAAQSLGTFFAYSRTQNPQAIGFSVEAVTAGGASAQSQRAIGLKRVAAPIAFQTNCFVGSFGKPVNYRMLLVDSSGAQIGTVITGSLAPYQLIRYLDIFAAAGVASGDFTNATARTLSNNPQSAGDNDFPIFVSFCTVQDNASFGADFRIGKSFEAFDQSYDRNNIGCTPTNGCTSYDYAITDVTKKDVFALFVRPPDHLQCFLSSDRLTDLEMQLREPDTVPAPLSYYPPGSAAFTRGPGPVVAGGNDLTGFYYETGPDIVRVSDGAVLRDFWSLEVSARELLPAPTTPIPYSINCLSGNGAIYARPYSAPDDF